MPPEVAVLADKKALTKVRKALRSVLTAETYEIHEFIPAIAPNLEAIAQDEDSLKLVEDIYLKKGAFIARVIFQGRNEFEVAGLIDTIFGLGDEDEPNF